MGQQGLRGGTVRQDGSGESQITDADLAEFMRLKALNPPTKEVFVFTVSHKHTGKDGKKLYVSEDMRQHPAKYGFADSAAAAAWQGSIELAK